MAIFITATIYPSSVSLKSHTKYLFFLDFHTLGILTSSQPNGLAVPDASIQQVNTTEEVMKLMDIGLNNRAKSATAMNERSSRSHRYFS